MSYQVIARKWRPQTFDEVTGQEIITRTLRNAIEYDRLHHAYLFSGARGVGKTTTARILAKSLNCHKTDGPNLSPCLLTDPDICSSCLEISESRSMDVLEIDAASHTGIDSVRETIIENIGFNPARDRYKVFIIDEVHQLSKPAFNALLKTLEEPPGNVVFVMATTELHKVPDTILSRCQEFQFRTIPLTKIFDRLKLIADAEKIDITDEALREIARSGEGSMRDAQSNFDQVISFSGEKITSADVTNALGFAGLPLLTRTLRSIADRQPREALNVVDELVSGGNDLRNFCRDMLGLFRDLLIFKVAEGEEHLFESAAFSRSEMQEMSSYFTEADLLRFFSALADTETKLRDAAHPRYVLEVGLVKLIEIRSVASMESLLARLDALAAGSGPPAITSAERQISDSATAPSEKKTLNLAPAPADHPVERSILPGDHRTDGFEPPSDPDDLAVYQGSRSDPEKFFDQPIHPIDSRPKGPMQFEPQIVRMPPLSAAELEHFDDSRLDDAYEERLLLTGDDLRPIGTVDTLVKLLFGDEPTQEITLPGVGYSAVAAKPAFDVAALRAEIGPVEEDVELPNLSSDPTDEELQLYVRAHPSVRAVMRVFRAKVVDVAVK